MSSTNLGRYHFMPWSRRGLSTAIPTVDGANLAPRVSLPVKLTVTSQDPSNTTTTQPVSVAMYGPGDVIGIDPNMVIRTEPRDLTNNFEPNYLAGIEFDAPDFPWLMTPAAPNGQRLRPWIALIVLSADTSQGRIPEFAEANQGTAPLPSITVSNVAALQPLDASWDWAHTQVTNEDGLATALRTDPGHAISRLLCPRRLDPERSYTALLVPAFNIGRLAGLGLDISKVTTLDPAWTGATPSGLAMPYYHRFSFHTSDEGDFESLVRKLKPTALQPPIGQRPVAVDQPGEGLPSAGTPLGLAGALTAPGTLDTPWSDPAKTAFQTGLQALINNTSPATDDPAAPNPVDPSVVPPIYGRWHAGVPAVDHTAAGWLNHLNLDPRPRAQAGTGTQVVQKDRTSLLASAWNQVDRVIHANQLLRQAQLARGALQQLYRQHLQLSDSTRVIRFSAPVHSVTLAVPLGLQTRAKTANQTAQPAAITVKAALEASTVPAMMVSGIFRRLTRPLGQIRLRQGLLPTTYGNLFNRVNTGSITIVPTLRPPHGLVTVDQVSNSFMPPDDDDQDDDDDEDDDADDQPPSPTDPKIVVASAMHFGKFTPALISSVPAQPNFTVVAAGTVPPPPPPPPQTRNASTAARAALVAGDSPDAATFRAASLDLTTVLQAALPVVTPPGPVDTASLGSIIVGRLDPVRTVVARIGSLVKYLNPLWNPPDPIAEIMAAPTFDQPLYKPLAQLSEEYILPGVESIQPNTLGLLQENHAFIEAFMVGANHEMARQLLWEGYPTDQRGSYFRQFWDVAGYVPRPGEPAAGPALIESLRDIPPIHTWPLGLDLGQHPNRVNVAQGNVVLLVRGELLRRYPNTIIFAGPAILGSEGQLVLDESAQAEASYLSPIYGAALSPDLTFFGFNLSVQDARGGTAASPHGYFFGFQQVPTETRFGLEPTAKDSPCQRWADLAWTNFATFTTRRGVKGPRGSTSLRAMALPQFVGGYTARRLASTAFGFVIDNLPGQLPDFVPPTTPPSDVQVSIANEQNDVNVNWGQDAAQTAYILLRRPFRILVHAQRMLP